MNDDFLKHYHKQPDQAFMQAVHRKISLADRRFSTMKKLVFATVSILVVLGLALGLSPRARAAALTLIREVGDLRFVETGDYPGEGEDVEIVDSTFLPLEEARLAFPGTISLPASLPEGYTLDPEVLLMTFDDGALPMAIVTWRNVQPDGSWASLSLKVVAPTGESPGLTWVVGEGALEEITIHGKPAAFLQGGWNYDTKSYDLGLQVESVQWNYDAHTFYELSSSEKLGVETLVRIAESIE